MMLRGLRVNFAPYHTRKLSSSTHGRQAATAVELPGDAAGVDNATDMPSAIRPRNHRQSSMRDGNGTLIDAGDDLPFACRTKGNAKLFFEACTNARHLLIIEAVQQTWFDVQRAVGQ